MSDYATPNLDGSTDQPEIDADLFQDAFGESLADALNLDTWQSGEDLAVRYEKLEREIADAIRREDFVRQRARREIFPLLATRPGAPPGAGVYAATVDHLETVHRSALLNGCVEACDGTTVVHDTLPITLAQAGVCLTSYHGDSGSWGHRLYRRDLRIASPDPVDELARLLNRRQGRAGFDETSRRDALSELARRGMMTYAEIAALVHRGRAAWRMGHGSPTPFELLVGAGMAELLARSLDLLTELILGHRRFVFVPSAPARRDLLTLGNSLHPLEYAIVATQEGELLRLLERGHYRGEWGPLAPRLKDFARDVAARVVVGVYRASAMAPAHLFYAHVDHAHEAALIALADSALQEHRGFPMLIDLADHLCRATFGTDTVVGSTRLAYVEAGQPFRYLAERQTRYG